MSPCRGCGAPNDPSCRCPKLNPAVAQHQAPPVKNSNPAIQDLVIADIVARKEVGLTRYGTLLQAHNGRDALMDAYQESLDLAVYLRQAIAERDDP